MVLCCLCVNSSNGLLKCNGVIDRMEDGFVIILLENKGIQIDLWLHQLPKGIEEGMFMHVVETGNEFIPVKSCQHKTITQMERSERLLEKLKKRK